MRAESRQRVDASPVQGVGRALEQLLAPALTAFACTDADAAQMAWRVARSVTAAAGFRLAGRLADTLLWDRWLPRRAGVCIPRLLCQVVAVVVVVAVAVAVALCIVGAAIVFSNVWQLSVGPVLAGGPYLAELPAAAPAFCDAARDHFFLAKCRC